jgi:hypothetical protein
MLNKLPKNLIAEIASKNRNAHRTLYRVGLINKPAEKMAHTGIYKFKRQYGYDPRKERLNKTPLAYKNKDWKYYYPSNKIYFYNTANGIPFLINKKGRRKVPKEIPNHYGRLESRKPIHNWKSYINRMNTLVSTKTKYEKGSGKRNEKRERIYNAIKKYYNTGNFSNVNKISMSDLYYFYKTNQRVNNATNTSKVVKRPGKVYTKFSSTRPYTKLNLVEEMEYAF